MPNKFPMPCQFDAGHGTFPNPPKLSDHYREMHSHEWTPKPKRATPPPPPVKVHKRVVCAACSVEVGLNNLRRHVRAAHPDITERPFDELIRQPKAKAPVPAVASRNAIEVAKPELEAPTTLDIDDADGIVTFVLEQLAGPVGVIPVEHFAAIFLWREQTAAFLRAVTKH